MKGEIRNGWVNEMPKRIWARWLGRIARETIGREAFEQRRETGRNCGNVNKQHGTDISTDLRKLGSGHHVRRHSSTRARQIELQSYRPALYPFGRTIPLVRPNLAASAYAYGPTPTSTILLPYPT